MIKQISINPIHKTGKLASMGAFLSGVIYAIILVIGLAKLASPEETIQDPLFTILELLIIIIATLMSVVMATIHLNSPNEKKVNSLLSLIFMILLTGITTGVHFVILTLSHQNEFTGLSWTPLFLSYRWPSVAYALDILAWDFFFGLSMLFAAPIFKGDRLKLSIRILMFLSGGLSVAGLIGVGISNMQIRMIGVLGYAGLAPIIFLLVAILFNRGK